MGGLVVGGALGLINVSAAIVRSAVTTPSAFDILQQQSDEREMK